MIYKSLGKGPSGKYIKKLIKSKNYKNGIFYNLELTEMGLKDVSIFKVLYEFLFSRKNTSPQKPLPAIKSDLKKITHENPGIVWFGHSSYLISHNGFNILVDPIIVGGASPVSFIGQPFKGTNVFSPDDLPEIDLLILTHDHYDHLSYQTMLKLKHKIKRAVAPLGVASHLEFWGILENIIYELDWDETLDLLPKIKLTAVPSRHFSGRLFKRNNTLWSAYVLEINGFKIFIGGDSGYGSHFKDIGAKYGPFDLAILECGQYNKYWPLIHMFPEQTVQATQELQAKNLMPAHWGKFSLSNHAWNEPVQRLLEASKNKPFTVIVPKIGQIYNIGADFAQENWWND